MTSTDEEILKEVLENWKGSNIYHKDVQAIAYQSISLSRKDEQKKILDLIDKGDWVIFSNGRSTDYVDEFQYEDSIKSLKQKISQLSGKEKK